MSDDIWGVGQNDRRKVCDACEGRGHTVAGHRQPCPVCKGSGRVLPKQPLDAEKIGTWLGLIVLGWIIVLGMVVITTYVIRWL